MQEMKENKTQTDEDLILSIIRNKGKASISDFITHTDLSRPNLNKALTNMEKEQLIKQIGDKQAIFYEINEPEVVKRK